MSIPDTNAVISIIDDAIADSLGPDWNSFQAAHHVMQWLTDAGLQIVPAAHHRLERSEPVGWMGIESAPKDGTPILTCRMGESVSWFNYTTFGGYAEPPEAAYWEEYTECWQPFQRPHDEWKPTHWMPLPSAPGTTPPEPVAEIERLRAALREIATVDENGLAEYTPQAMVAQARAALGDAS